MRFACIVATQKENYTQVKINKYIYLITKIKYYKNIYNVNIEAMVFNLYNKIHVLTFY